MSLPSTTHGRMATLAARKAQVEAALQREYQAAAPDSLRITELKRQKLHIKEEATGLAKAS
jgi:hypothetical protein